MKSIKSTVDNAKVRMVFFIHFHIVIMRDVENVRGVIKRTKKNLFY